MVQPKDIREVFQATQREFDQSQIVRPSNKPVLNVGLRVMPLVAATIAVIIFSHEHHASLASQLYNTFADIFQWSSATIKEFALRVSMSRP